MNTSASGGFLTPTQTSPNSIGIEDALQSFITGITGLCGQLVRPRWQTEAPREPKTNVTWCAFGITSHTPQGFAEILHKPEAEGHDEMRVYESLDVLLSFYGPAAIDTARLFRLGAQIPQNHAFLRPFGLTLTRVGSMVHIPALVALQWQERVDITLTLQQQTTSTHAVLNLKKIEGNVSSDQGNVFLGCKTCTHACWREE